MLDTSNLSTPCYVIDEGLLIKNLEKIRSVIDATNDESRAFGNTPRVCKILLAQKAFSAWKLYPLINEYLDGTTASSLFEAKLGKEHFPGEVHVFAPAYRECDFAEIAEICDHIVFNSLRQLEKYADKCQSKSVGLRINPEYSEIETEMYNPCAPTSRLGATLDALGDELPSIDGLHFHTMCEQNSDTLERTLDVVEAKFGKYLKRLKWLNFGGGHHITRDDYDIARLIACIRRFQDKYDLEIYLEPGEAIALNAGFLVAGVLDVGEIRNGVRNVILDTSAACHMPDVLEMPYKPKIIGAVDKSEYAYRLGAHTCLAGDVIGEYSFDSPLNIGDKLVFTDMAIYTMVKNNTFNGINLPSILIRRIDGKVETVKEFGYEGFKGRLG
ncbi:MAG: carboxynorspermidine decarboxylase [Oscillospiraceae bacterium]|nr:carboxynorspermidine decarboxylase [Oscillospiraceae bacterium]